MELGRSGAGGRRVHGLVVGIVTNITDPESRGRVKVRFPWMDGADDPVESHWARVVGFYAGGSRGAMTIPEVGDEVMVAFEKGDPNHPYVIGAVWNGEHTVPGPGNPDGKNDHKYWRSRAGHDFEFLDTDGGEKIRLVDCSTNNSIVYDTAADTITTEAKTGSIHIKAPKGLLNIECTDLVITTKESKQVEVGKTHTVSVGGNRNVQAKPNINNQIKTSLTLTAGGLSASSGSHLGASGGGASINQGDLNAEVEGWLEINARDLQI